jgi:hypothetical protein
MGFEVFIFVSNGDIPSFGTPKISEFNFRGQNTSPWNVFYIVGKVLRRATSLLQTSSKSEVWAGCYELPKSRESKPGQFRDSSLGVPGLKAIWMWVWRSNAENTIWGKAVASLEFGLWWVKWVRVARGLSQHQEWFRMWTNQLVSWFWCKTE